jgi:alpha-galactosidase
MPKITFIGAGSTVFAKNLLGDILAYPELAGSTIALHDIDEERLQTTRIVAERLAAGRDAHPRIETHLDRCAALDGADYAISMFQIGGYRPSTVVDFEIPKKYGLRQTIGDTLGIGGIMRGLRTIPVFLDVARDMERVCPDAWLLNYVNPMAINTMAIQKATRIKNVGLCHSVQGTVEHLSEDIDVPAEEIRYVCAGINHMAFYLNFWRRTPDGGVEDLYPYIQRVIDEGRVPEDNMVRYEMFRRLGYFVTESSEHFAEYVPWFIKRDRPDLLEKFNIPLDEYIHRCEFQIAGWEFARRRMERPDEVTEEDLQAFVSYLRSQKLASKKMIEGAIEQLLEFDKPKQSLEYGSGIIHSIETNTPRVVYGNVLNHGLIDNLPEGCAVEVPCLVDANGVQPTKIGALPTHLAALMRTQVNVQELTVEAALTGRREAIYHAAMLDPHTAAELDLEQIWNLVDDLIAAHGDWLPAYD